MSSTSSHIPHVLVYVYLCSQCGFVEHKTSAWTNFGACQRNQTAKFGNSRRTLASLLLLRFIRPTVLVCCLYFLEFNVGIRSTFQRFKRTPDKTQETKHMEISWKLFLCGIKLKLVHGLASSELCYSINSPEENIPLFHCRDIPWKVWAAEEIRCEDKSYIDNCERQKMRMIWQH